MSRYKLLSLDVDGTLIGEGTYPTPRVVEAVIAARKKGVAVALGTGRASEACYHILKQLELNGLHIFFDGAAIVNWPSNDIVFLQALSPRAAQRLIELCREYDLFLEIYAHDFYFIEKQGALAKHQQEKLQLQPIVTDLMSLVNRIKIVKGQVIAANKEDKRRADLLTIEMEEYCKMSWSFDYSNGMYFGNAISKFVSKGNALREMVDYLGIDISETLAVGDSFNDLPIFQVAHTKVAMGHAPDELKQIADWVAPPIDQDGVAAAIEKYIL
jgi:hypothetical protein